MFKTTYFFSALFFTSLTLVYPAPNGRRIRNNGVSINNNIVSGPEVPYPENPQIGQIIIDSFDKNPGHISQIDAETGTETTFAEMKDHSIRLAIWLKNQKVGLGDIITLTANKRLDNYIPQLAAIYIGAIYYPWYANTTDEVRKSMKLLRPKAMFIIPESIEIFKEAARLENVPAKIVSFDNHAEFNSLNDILSAQSVEDVKNFKVLEIRDTANTPSTILPTSGSTGVPKNVVHSYKSMVTNFMEYNNFPVKNSRYLSYTTPYWISDVALFLKSIKYEATRILHPKFDVIETPNIIEEFKIDYWKSHSMMLAALTKSEFFESQIEKLNSLLVYQISGSAAIVNVINDFKRNLPHVKVINSLGITEVGSPVTSQNEYSSTIDSLGFLLPNIKMKVIDLDSNETLGAREKGELCFKLPEMMLGYYKNDAETKKLIDSEGWMHSGDVGYYDENGEVFFSDRIKDEIMMNGVTVSGNELAKILLIHPDVLGAVVVGIFHETGEKPTAFVKRKTGSLLTKENLIKTTFEDGNGEILSGGIIFLDDFPRLANGKVAVMRLKEMVQGNK